MQLTRTDGMGLWEFMTSRGIKYLKADFPWLTAESLPKVLSVLDFQEYITLVGRGEAIGWLYNRLGRVWTYIGPVLDADLPYGFNDHTDRHTLWVSQTGLELLSRAGKSFDGQKRVDRETELLMILVGMTHDLGNLVSRKKHSEHSVALLNELFANREGYESEWEAVIQAVRYHDEPALASGEFKLIQGWPLLWALVIADKLHVGRDRVGDKSLVTGPDGSLEGDDHVVLNSLVTRSTWYLAGNTFVWRLDFSVELLEEKFESVTNFRDRVWVPKEYQDAYREHKVPYRDTFTKKFVETYGERIKLASDAVFLLFPWIEEFKIVLADTDSRGKVEQTEFEMWGRGREI